jgi:hypothetical protein
MSPLPFVPARRGTRAPTDGVALTIRDRDVLNSAHCSLGAPMPAWRCCGGLRRHGRSRSRVTGDKRRPPLRWPLEGDARVSLRFGQTADKAAPAGRPEGLASELRGPCSLTRIKLPRRLMDWHGAVGRPSPLGLRVVAVGVSGAKVSECVRTPSDVQQFVFAASREVDGMGGKA